MDTLLVTVRNKTELQFISDVLKRMRIEAKVLSNEEQEDLGLIKLMKQADRLEKVSRESIMTKLGR